MGPSLPTPTPSSSSSSSSQKKARPRPGFTQLEGSDIFWQSRSFRPHDDKAASTSMVSYTEFRALRSPPLDTLGSPGDVYIGETEARLFARYDSGWYEWTSTRYDEDAEEVVVHPVYGGCVLWIEKEVVGWVKRRWLSGKGKVRMLKTPQGLIQGVINSKKKPGKSQSQSQTQMAPPTFSQPSASFPSISQPSSPAVSRIRPQTQTSLNLSQALPISVPKPFSNSSSFTIKPPRPLTKAQQVRQHQDGEAGIDADATKAENEILTKENRELKKKVKELEVEVRELKEDLAAQRKKRRKRKREEDTTPREQDEPMSMSIPSPPPSVHPDADQSTCSSRLPTPVSVLPVQRHRSTARKRVEPGPTPSRLPTPIQEAPVLSTQQPPVQSPTVSGPALPKRKRVDPTPPAPSSSTTNTDAPRLKEVFAILKRKATVPPVSTSPPKRKRVDPPTATGDVTGPPLDRLSPAGGEEEEEQAPVPKTKQGSARQQAQGASSKPTRVRQLPSSSSTTPAPALDRLFTPPLKTKVPPSNSSSNARQQVPSSTTATKGPPLDRLFTPTPGSEPAPVDEVQEKPKQSLVRSGVMTMKATPTPRPAAAGKSKREPPAGRASSSSSLNRAVSSSSLSTGSIKPASVPPPPPPSKVKQETSSSGSLSTSNDKGVIDLTFLESDQEDEDEEPPMKREVIVLSDSDDDDGEVQEVPRVRVSVKSEEGEGTPLDYGTGTSRDRSRSEEEEEEVGMDVDVRRDEGSGEMDVDLPDTNEDEAMQPELSTNPPEPPDPETHNPLPNPSPRTIIKPDTPSSWDLHHIPPAHLHTSFLTIFYHPGKKNRLYCRKCADGHPLNRVLWKKFDRGESVWGMLRHVEREHGEWYGRVCEMPEEEVGRVVEGLRGGG
ncbi:hypothetical protein PM082_022103 [Marasmius tenuissimus]|nr:hypothetical protein PM082_022103 [Marasmius tenuissimus]